MEKQMLAVALTSREGYDRLKENLDTKQLTREFVLLFDSIGDYYSTDSNVPSIDVELLREKISRTTSAQKKADHLIKIVDAALGYSLTPEFSATNINEVLRSAREHSLANKLAVALVNKSKDRDELLEAYTKTRESKDNGDDFAGEDVEVFDSSVFDELISETDGTSILQVGPSSLQQRLGRGLRGGHHVVVFARPEAGKSLFSINLASTLARRGFSGIYFINEDRTKSIAGRFVSNLSGVNFDGVGPESFQGALRSAKDAGLDRITIVGISPGTPRIIEKCIEKYNPTWIVVDQLRNLAVRAENRTNQLERAATEIRNIAKRHNVLAISVTQAGDSATDRDTLNMGDVDSSNTGIPATADLMVGIGVTEELKSQGLRMLTLCKNKISNNHESFIVRVNEPLSRMTSVNESQ